MLATLALLRRWAATSICIAIAIAAAFRPNLTILAISMAPTITT